MMDATGLFTVTTFDENMDVTSDPAPAITFDKDVASTLTNTPQVEDGLTKPPSF